MTAGAREWEFVSPPQLHLITDYNDFLYLNALFLLRARDLNILHGGLITTINTFFETISLRWRELLSDLKEGSVSPTRLSDDKNTTRWLSIINSALSPEESRVAELDCIFREAARGSSPLYGIGLAKLIWSKLSVVCCLCAGEALAPHEKSLRDWIGSKSKETQTRKYFEIMS